MWPIYLIGLSWNIPNAPEMQYSTLQLKSLGFGTFETVRIGLLTSQSKCTSLKLITSWNLLTIPAYVLFMLQLLFWTWLSEKINQRFLLGAVGQLLYNLPLLIALEVIPTTTSHWVKYTISILLVGYVYVHAILVAVTSRNVGTVRTRTVASALYNMCVQANSIIASQIYMTSKYYFFLLVGQSGDG
jgi:hypothetical protein